MNICTGTLSKVTGRFVTFETVFNCLTKLHITFICQQSTIEIYL